MPRQPDASGHDRPDPRQLLALLRADELDAAIDAGLMQCMPGPDCGLDPDALALLSAARERLQTAWQARERHRARSLRLARIAAEREARRKAAAPPVQTVASARPALPSAAASALARARAKAAARGRT